MAGTEQSTMLEQFNERWRAWPPAWQTLVRNSKATIISRHHGWRFLIPSAGQSLEPGRAARHPEMTTGAAETRSTEKESKLTDEVK